MNKSKEECSFGKKCYRLNPIHFKEFSHDHLSVLIIEFGLEDKDADIEFPDNFKAEVSVNTIKDQLRVILSMKRHDEKVSDYKAGKMSAGESSSLRLREEASQKNTIAEKWKAAAPFHMFMTKVLNNPDTLKENLSIGLSELFDNSLGDIDETLQINFMVDINFLMKNLSGKQCSDKPMLILYETSNVDELKQYKNNQVKAICVKPKSMFGHHHTKMTIILYKDKNVRVVITTANLIEKDWTAYSQGVWISPSCPPITDSSKGESSTDFRSSLVSYLSAYKVKDLDKWIKLVKGADFSQVNVCFIGSVPSTGSAEMQQWGLGRLKFLLQKHVPAGATEVDWPALIQCSSIGSLGTTPCEWLEGQMKSAMLGSANLPLSKTPLHLVYPCKRDVERSISGGGCLPYAYRTHRNQLWISEFVHKWRADSRKRNLIMPHLKTYCRVSPDWKKAAWFLLTSANLSKAAWGRSTHQGSGQNIMSYEGGVLFLPQLMIGRKHFEISHSPNQEKDKLPFPYDLPPTKYDSSEKMWLVDYNEQN